MKNVVYSLVLIGLLGLAGGCGPGATDTSGAAPPPSQDNTQQELEKAMQSGQIDPSSYGKGS